MSASDMSVHFVHGVWQADGKSVAAAAVDGVSSLRDMHGDSVDASIRKCGQRVGGFHITLIPKHELEQAAAGARAIHQGSIDSVVDLARTAITDETFLDLGLGSVRRGASEETYFKSVVWPLGFAVRKVLQLKSKDFHVTIAFSKNDIHGVRKDASTLLLSGTPDEICRAWQSICTLYGMSKDFIAKYDVERNSAARKQKSCTIQERNMQEAIASLPLHVAEYALGAAQELLAKLSSSAVSDCDQTLTAVIHPLSVAADSKLRFSGAWTLCHTTLEIRALRCAVLGKLKQMQACHDEACTLIMEASSLVMSSDDSDQKGDSDDLSLPTLLRQVSSEARKGTISADERVWAKKQLLETPLASEEIASWLSSKRECSASRASTAVVKSILLGAYFDQGRALVGLGRVSEGLCVLRDALLQHDELPGPPSSQMVGLIEQFISKCDVARAEQKRVRKERKQQKAAPYTRDHLERQTEHQPSSYLCNVIGFNWQQHPIPELGPRRQLVAASPGQIGPEQLKIPRFFSWIIPNRLAGVALPVTKEHVSGLDAMGIRLLVTLFDDPLDPALFVNSKVRNFYIHTLNYKAPPISQLEQAVELIETALESGEGVAVHCGGGKGRAGTLLSCYLVKHGPFLPFVHLPEQRQNTRSGCPPFMSSSSAYSLLRRMRPGSVETKEQESAIAQYEKILWTGAMAAQQSREEVGPERNEEPPWMDALPLAESKSDSEDTGLGRFPSIAHLPFSPQVNNDDIQLPVDMAQLFTTCEVVVTEKLDGGNCCLFQGRVYARTHKHETTHPWFSPVKQMYASLFHSMTPRQQQELALFGESMVAVHSIEYNNLCAFFYLFSVLHVPSQTWLSFADVEALARQLSLPCPPVVFRGRFKSLQEMAKLMKAQALNPSGVAKASADGPAVCPEGFVVRLASSFSNSLFERSIAKYVRKGHVQTDETWTRTWKKATLGCDYSDYAKVSKAVDSAESAPASKPQPSHTQKQMAGSGLGDSAKARKEHEKLKKNRTKQAPQLVLMVGLPCSGKSTFASQLERTGGAGDGSSWTRVCRDDIGSKAETEALFARTLLGKGGGKRCVMDGCNVSTQERKYWLDLAMRPKSCAAVFFDVPADTCKRRALARAGHPTGDLFSWGGVKIIDSFLKKLAPPLQQEGFSSVHTIRNMEQANQLLWRWGAEPAELPSDVAAAAAAAATEEEKKGAPDEHVREDCLARVRSLVAQTKTMDFARACQLARIDPKNVVLAYVVGSRLWGHATAASDYDLVMVLKNMPDTSQSAATHVSDQLDVVTMSTAEFRKRMQSHNLQQIVVDSLPDEAVWHRAKDMAGTLLPAVHLPSLISYAEDTVEKDQVLAAKWANKNGHEKAKKVLVHTIRVLRLCLQMAQSGRITHFGAADDDRMKLLENPESDFSSFSAEPLAMAQKLLDELRGADTEKAGRSGSRGNRLRK